MPAAEFANIQNAIIFAFGPVAAWLAVVAIVMAVSLAIFDVFIGVVRQMSR